MSASMFALLGYAGWTKALLLGIAALRAIVSVRTGRPANRVAVSDEDVSPFSARLCTDPLALWLLAARLSQSVVQLWSTAVRAVQLRFLLLMVQLRIQSLWRLRLLTWEAP